MTSRRRLFAIPFAAAVAFAFPAVAGDLTLDGAMTQGGLVIGRTAPGTTVAVDGRSVRVSPEGLFLLGFGRDAAKRASVRLTGPDGGVVVRTIDVAARKYDVQRIDGLPPKQVTPDAETLARIERERALVKEVRAEESDHTGFASGFAWPVIGPISGVYGSQRILNGEPRAPHFGVDIAAPPGTPVVVCADGTVALVHEDMFLSGKTVLIDHGHGLTSTYIHMSQILAREGDRVKKGDAIGRVGGTGRAMGPHLHWGLNLFATPLDPALLVGPMPPGQNAASPLSVSR